MGKVAKKAGLSVMLTIMAAMGTMAQAQGPAPSLPGTSVDGARPVAALLADAPHAVLKKGRLRAELLLPDPQHGFYRGTRFDWSGMILDVRLGAARFYGPWFDAVAPGVRDYVDQGSRLVTGPNTNATGPAEEFQGDNANPTPGYNEAAPGGTFIKIGVGRLRRLDDRAYNRFNNYAIVDGGQWQIDRRADSIRFIHTLVPAADGYGYRYEKTVTLERDGALIIRHMLRNTGSKPIETQVYSHNFMRLGDHAVDQDILVRSPLLRGQTPKDPTLAGVEGDQLHFAHALQKGESVAFPAPTSLAVSDRPVFELRHADGMAIAAYSDMPIARALFWNIRKANAVEPYVALKIAPGSQQDWSWRYSFTAR